jgi:hypothetical protein
MLPPERVWEFGSLEPHARRLARLLANLEERENARRPKLKPVAGDKGDVGDVVEHI